MSGAFNETPLMTTRAKLSTRPTEIPLKITRKITEESRQRHFIGLEDDDGPGPEWSSPFNWRPTWDWNETDVDDWQCYDDNTTKRDNCCKSISNWSAVVLQDILSSKTHLEKYEEGFRSFRL